MGVVGVAWGTTIPNLGIHLFFWHSYVLGTPSSTHIFSTWLRPAVAVVPFALFTYAAERWFPAANLLRFLGGM